MARTLMDGSSGIEDVCDSSALGAGRWWSMDAINATYFISRSLASILITAL